MRNEKKTPEKELSVKGKSMKGICLLKALAWTLSSLEILLLYTTCCLRNPNLKISIQDCTIFFSLPSYNTLVFLKSDFNVARAIEAKKQQPAVKTKHNKHKNSLSVSLGIVYKFTAKKYLDIYGTTDSKCRTDLSRKIEILIKQHKWRPSIISTPESKFLIFNADR